MFLLLRLVSESQTYWNIRISGLCIKLKTSQKPKFCSLEVNGKALIKWCNTEVQTGLKRYFHVPTGVHILQKQPLVYCFQFQPKPGSRDLCLYGKKEILLFETYKSLCFNLGLVLPISKLDMSDPD